MASLVKKAMWGSLSPRPLPYLLVGWELIIVLIFEFIPVVLKVQSLEQQQQHLGTSCVCVCVCDVCDVVSNSSSPHGLYVAHQVPLSMGFSRQEYWSGLPFPPLGDLSGPGMEPACPVFPSGGFFTPEPPGKPQGTSEQCRFSSPTLDLWCWRWGLMRRLTNPLRYFDMC